MAENLVAIAVGQQTIKFAKWDGKTLSQVVERSTPDTLVALKETLVAGFTAVRQHATIDGVTISVAGDGTVEGLRYLDIRAELESLFTLPVVIETRANCIALAEMAAGVGVGKQAVVVIAADEDLDCAVVLGGKIWHGAHDLGGRLGYMLMKPQATLATIAAPARIAERYAAATGEQLSGETVLARASQRDTLAIRLVAEAEAALGKVIFNLQYTIDPECFIISGAISANTKFIECVQAAAEAVQAEVKAAPLAPTILAGGYHGEACLRGAVANFLQER
ncbi:ROK family protein [Lacticaseibacillus sp. GG6-2]